MRVLDLFSGIGGFSLGLERAGMQTVAFCEIDKKAQLVLKKHWPHVPVYDDVKELSRGRLESDGIGRIDVICGGFPCQDISVAGKGAGLAGERSGLWSEIARLAGELRPRFVIVENVSALLGRGIDRVLGDLAEIGYDAEWHCIPAAAVGAPHQRDRIWIVAYPNGEWQSQPQGVVANIGGRIGNCCEEMADANGQLSHRSRYARNRRPEPADRCEDAADTDRAGRQEFDLAAFTEKQGFNTGLFAHQWHYWSVEPPVGRVADGIPNRVDRLKQLGNTVVPQIPELIGRAIMDVNHGMA